MVRGHGGWRPLICDKQKEAVKQYASHLFPAPDLMGLLMDLNVPKLGFRHITEYMSCRGWACTGPLASRSPSPSPVGMRSRTRGRSWSPPLTYDHPCRSTIPGRVGPLVFMCHSIDAHQQHVTFVFHPFLPPTSCSIHLSLFCPFPSFPYFDLGDWPHDSDPFPLLPCTTLVVVTSSGAQFAPLHPVETCKFGETHPL